jgi:hypothetical protein
MKRCVIISNYVVNQYRESVLKEKIKLFKSLDIDVFLVSSDHIKKYDGVDHYLTLNTKWCEDKYISENLHLYISANSKNFWYKFPNKSNLHYQYSLETYFIKMFQTTIHHCDLLEYEFVFFMEFDILFHDTTLIENVCKNVDTSKYYFYKVVDKVDNNSYHSLFFYGNVKCLKNIFSDKNLKKISELSKQQNIWSVENSLWIMINNPMFETDTTNFVQNSCLDDVSYVNLFTSNNIVDIFYDYSLKKYYFLHSKNWNDHNQNKIGAELYLDNVLIYKDVFTTDGKYNWFELENNRHYIIKKYDGEVCEEKLYTVKQIYTDPDTPSTIYFCTNN